MLGKIAMTKLANTESALSAMADFCFGAAHELHPPKSTTPLPPLGPLAAFTGNWTGSGFNTIFRPNSSATPTPLPVPGTGPSDNILELNLTQETLSFSATLGSVPNRGFTSQPDAFLNGVPYLQSINDVTSGTPVGIHFEPGIWIAVPATTNPNVSAQTFARMASIPHGTTIVAQGITAALNGVPPIGALNITPFQGGNPGSRINFPSQTVASNNTFRLPQNLTGIPITQAMVTDPNTVLRNQIAHQTVTATHTLFVSTNPASPIAGGPIASTIHLLPNFAGGTSNIAFLQTVPTPPPSGQGPNAQSFQMDAVFWIETVVYQVHVPPLQPGQTSHVLAPVPTAPPTPLVPSFVAKLPYTSKPYPGGVVNVTTTQIQYSQMVLLNFNGLSWPHASVATLVPADPITISL
jgi:hypothetical protein